MVPAPTSLALPGLGAPVLTSPILDQFHIGLDVPEAGPLVPHFSEPSFVSGSFHHHADEFRMLSAAMEGEIEAIKRGATRVPVRVSWALSGILGFPMPWVISRTVGGLPRRLGPSGEAYPGRHWTLLDSNLHGDGSRSFSCLLGSDAGDSAGMLVSVRHREDRTIASVDYRTEAYQIVQTGAVTRDGRGDFTSLWVNVSHKALESFLVRNFMGAEIYEGGNLDVFFSLFAASFLSGPFQEEIFGEGLSLHDHERSTIDRPVRYILNPGVDQSERVRRLDVSRHFSIASARTVFVDDFTEAEPRPVFSVRHHRNGNPDGSGNLHILYYHARGGLPYPQPLVDFSKVIVTKIDETLG